MNRLTRKVVVGVIAASLVAVFVIAVWPTGDSPQARPQDKQQSSETVQGGTAGTAREGGHPAERRGYTEKLDSGQLRLGWDSALATLDPARAIEALEAASGGDNPDAIFSSTDEVVRRLLAQRIAGGELRLPPSAIALAANSTKAARVGPTRAALQQTTGSSAAVSSTCLAGQTQRRDATGVRERGLASDTKSVTKARRRGLRPAGNTDIRLAPAEPKQIQIQPAETKPSDPKKIENVKVIDPNSQ